MKTMISVKTDTELRDKAKAVAEELGFSLSALINASLRQIVQDRKVTFSLSPEPSENLLKTIQEVEADYKKGKNIKTFSSAEEMIEHLNKNVWK